MIPRVRETRSPRREGGSVGGGGYRGNGGGYRGRSSGGGYAPRRDDNGGGYREPRPNQHRGDAGHHAHSQRGE
ncbi:MAG: hypothetical protein QG561_1055 [Patescibacteria group bacterium]|nr:hypothetical protein [Patescibacteria group bacterium]